MISFNLKCSDGHEFEAWFGSSADYDDQQERGLVRCPFCDNASVSKALMTPQLPRKGNQKPAAMPHQQPQKTPSTPASPNSSVPPNSPAQHTLPPQGASAINPEDVAALYSRMREMQNRIVAEYDDVGNQFAEEARKIHYGEAEERGIYGQTTREEAEALAEEGIDALAMPWLPPEN